VVYLKMKFSALMSYVLTVAIFGEVLPLGHESISPRGQTELLGS